MRISPVLQLTLRLVILAAAMLAAHPTPAQLYPAKPIRVILPVPAGGVADVVMRATGQELTKRLGQPVILEYRHLDFRRGADCNFAEDQYKRHHRSD